MSDKFVSRALVNLSALMTTVIPSHRRVVAFASAFLALAALNGCSSESDAKPEAEPVELKTTDAPSIDTPEAALFQEAKRLYRAGLYTVAIDSFNSLRVNYPLSPYAEFAEIKIADSHFETRDFSVAAAGYEEFAKSHPASSSMPYVLMRAGRSHQLSNKGVGRDVLPLEKAKEFYTRLVKEYPNSAYTQQGRAYLIEVAEELAEHEKLIMEYYRKQSNEKAAAARARIYEDKERDAKARLSDDKMVMAAMPSARTPANPNVISVTRQLPQRHAEVRDPVVPRPVRAHQDLLLETAEESSTLGLQRVQCRSDKIFFYLKDALSDRDFLNSNKVLSPKAGKVELRLPGVTAREASIDCLGKHDLTVAADGTVTLLSDRSWDVFSLDNPARLLLVQR